ncbi:hypothetical protein LY78DRAFT_316791 [Colletotrichum sublineola]|nr:hypothetical protein LY78DRAFT_316791 [Colletotrichum sublineola]
MHTPLGIIQLTFCFFSVVWLLLPGCACVCVCSLLRVRLCMCIDVRVFDHQHTRRDVVNNSQFPCARSHQGKLSLSKKPSPCYGKSKVKPPRL